MCWLPVKQERKLKQFRLPLDLLERLNRLRKARGYDSLNEVVEALLYRACEKAEESLKEDGRGGPPARSQ